MSSKLKLQDPLGVLVSFKDMWYQIFLYCLATTVLMHGLASLIALRALRKHKLGRYIPIVIAVAGFLYPLTGGIITSALISWIYHAAKIGMPNYFAFLWGGGQALLLLIVSFTRIIATL
ncbi:transmembrane protein 170A-like [Rhopilema esculentum]|uniref:transmembrane protein 170A-like n=1 Tax=Rhopilema esculentum TaxID=499914 RepID=UPI0031D90A9C